jgi:hypothetical protein
MGGGLGRLPRLTRDDERVSWERFPARLKLVATIVKDTDGAAKKAHTPKPSNILRRKTYADRPSACRPNGPNGLPARGTGNPGGSAGMSPGWLARMGGLG